MLVVSRFANTCAPRVGQLWWTCIMRRRPPSGFGFYNWIYLVTFACRHAACDFTFSSGMMMMHLAPACTFSQHPSSSGPTTRDTDTSKGLGPWPELGPGPSWALPSRMVGHLPGLACPLWRAGSAQFRVPPRLRLRLLTAYSLLPPVRSRGRGTVLMTTAAATAPGLPLPSLSKRTAKALLASSNQTKAHSSA